MSSSWVSFSQWRRRCYPKLSSTALCKCVLLAKKKRSSVLDGILEQLEDADDSDSELALQL